MARLSAQDYQTIQAEQPKVITPTVQPSITPAQPQQNQAATIVPPTQALPQSPVQKVLEQKPITTAIRKDYPDLGKEIAGSFGADFPDDATWDKLDFANKTAWIGSSVVQSGVKLAIGLPKAFVQALPKFVVQGSRPIQNLMERYLNDGFKLTPKAAGEELSLGKLSKQGNAQVPVLDSIPGIGKYVFAPEGNYYESANKSKDEVSYIARQSGVPSVLANFLGNVVGAGSVVSQALGDLTISASMAETMGNALKPRTAFNPSAPLTTEPIKFVERNVNGRSVYQAADESAASQYFSLSKSFAKEKWGGNTTDTFWKTSPTYGGGVELSVVKHVDAKPGSIIKMNGVPVVVTQGKFGPEIKLHGETLPGVSAPESLPASPNPEDPNFGVTPQAPGTSDSFQKVSIPTQPIKGFENKLVTGDQILNLDGIGKALKLSPNVVESLVRNVTGKSVAADLTQGEYVKAAQELSNFKNPHIPETEIPGLSRMIEPQRHWMSKFEENTGYPIWSKIGKPLFEADSLSKVKIYNAENWIDNIRGEYKGDEFGRVIRAYRLGDEAAITENPNLSTQQKTDLILINEQITDFFTQVAGETNINLAEFENNPTKYVPELADLGGKFLQYKDLSKPVKGPEKIILDNGKEVEGSSFFSKQKKEGNLNIPIDNIWQLMDIYSRAGYKAKFFDNIKNDFNTLHPSLPEEVGKSVNSTIQEVLGYGGPIEKWMDKNANGFFNKITGGKANLPADFTRRLSNAGMGWVYSNVLNQPATWFRNLLSYPTIGYANLGSEFMTSAMMDFIKNPKAAFEKARQKGFIMDSGAGGDVDFRGDVSLPEKALNLYSKANVTPNSYADNTTRALIVDQADKIFQNYLGEFQQKKITWDQFMQKTQLNGFSVPDKNIIIGRLNKGDIEGASNAYIREFIDNSVWPYQKGSSGRLTYGVAGKAGSMLLKWPLEYASTLKNWVTRGQWDKIIRLYASSSALDQTFKESFGWDIGSSFFLGPVLGLGLPPLQKMAASTIGAFQAVLNGNFQALEENKDEIVQTLKNSGRPGGVERQNFEAFLKTWDKGPRQDGKYPIYSKNGNLQYYGSFKDAWNQLWGFPTTEKIANSEFLQKEKKLDFVSDRAKANAKKEIVRLVTEGDTKGLNEFVAGLVENKINVTMSKDDYNKTVIPYSDELFKQLTPEARMMLFSDFKELRGL